jgi:hypothetical protein
MGRVRDYDYDAVIGVGGIGQEAKRYQIDQKINWVGMNPTRRLNQQGRGVAVTFENFRLFEEHGPLLKALAPALAVLHVPRHSSALSFQCCPVQHVYIRTMDQPWRTQRFVP